MIVTFSDPQSVFDALCPDEGPYFSEQEYWQSCKETFETALESLKASLATYEKHVPRESRQVAEDRDWFEEMAIRLSELGVNL
jgi:hypothetical protein